VVKNMQQLTVQLAIPIPEDQVIISKVELEELKRSQLTGVYWTMKDLETRTGRKKEWLIDNVLYVPKFQKILDGFVYYPKGKGSPWAFQATKMAKFLEENFHLIFGG
jgi:phage pi2 protein 07